MLVPAYNEETVIVRTIRSVLNSDYKNLHVIVIDDGSTDRTAEVAREAYAAEIAAGRVQVLTKPNGGKAAALNYALERLNEEIYVGIDADTVIAADAISKLIPHFEDPTIGAMAGNAKVGNRVNLWTRWQALEYITSQNFERRALDLFHVVTVVPGAIGAWRTAAGEGGGRLSAEHRGRRRRPDDEPAGTGPQGGLRRPLAGLYRSADRREGADAAALPLVVWNSCRRCGSIARRLCATRRWACSRCRIFSSSRCCCRWCRRLSTSCSWPACVNFFIDRYYHPESASAASLEKLVVYFLGFLLIDFITSSAAFSLERHHPANKGDGWLLFHIWLQRFAYRQVFSIVLFKTLKRAIDGKPFNWDKIERTAKMSKATEATDGDGGGLTGHRLSQSVRSIAEENRHFPFEARTALVQRFRTKGLFLILAAFSSAELQSGCRAGVHARTPVRNALKSMGTPSVESFQLCRSRHELTACDDPHFAVSYSSYFAISSVSSW